MSLATLPRRFINAYHRYGFLATVTRGVRKLQRMMREQPQRQTPCSVDSLAAEYDLSPAFLTALLDSFKVNIAPNDTFTTFMARFEPKARLYFSFAVTTSVRGREVYGTLAPYLPSEGTGRRYLDIGCAYGGFLRAFHEHGYTTYGIEISSKLYNFGALNCQGLTRNQIWHDDFLTMPTQELPGFDCITCNDVIEHVEDASVAMDKMATLLNPGGVLYMEIPNKDCIEFVREDGHFLLFGINLLERADATVLYETMVNARYSSMGEFYTLDYYTDRFTRLGFQVEVLPKHAIGTLDDVDRLLEALDTAYTNWHGQYGNTGTIGPLVSAKYRQYLEELQAKRRGLTDEQAVTDFTRRYLTTFWALVIRKSA